MQYFVAFKDSDDIRWQVELLYESIKLLGLANNFIVSIQTPIKNHLYQNIIYCKDIKSAHISAIEKGYLKFPFVHLQPHTFLTKEVESFSEMPLFYDGSSHINWNSSVVNYENGYLPYFHKDRIIDSINFSFNIPLPFKIILEIPSHNQPNVVIMQKLVYSWMESNLIRANSMI